MYCLKVITACPDYKRPYASVTVKHFSTKEAAEVALFELKKEYMDDWGLEWSVEVFDKKLKSGELSNEVYSDSYMDMEPFEYEISLK